MIKNDQGTPCVHWLCRQPTPYNDFLFRRLSQEPSLRLIVHYRDRGLPSHPWRSALAEDYCAQYYKLVIGLDWHVLFLPLKDRRALFVVAGWEHPTSIVLLTLLRLLRRSYVLWTDTPNLGRKRGPFHAFLRSAWLRWVFKGSVRVMSTGKPGLKALGMMGAPTDRMVNFPFYLDLDAYARDIRPPRYDVEHPLRIVSSGRIDNRLKGHDLAIQALARASAGGGVPFQYCIAGTGPDEIELKRCVQRLGLEDKVEFVGWMEREALRTLYLDADLLIHPSPTHDPFPNAVLEGMAAGLVVLGSDVSGSVVDRIENGLNGFIHRAGDVDQLADQLGFLLHHPESIPDIARRARETAEKWPVEYGVETIKEIAGHTKKTLAQAVHCE